MVKSDDLAPRSYTLTLNEDVYFAIIALLDTQADVSALMRSCWTLYRLGTNRLLQMGASIRTDEQLVSFCRFIQRLPLGNAHYLTDLSICIPRLRIDNEAGSESDLEDYKLLEGAPLLARVVGKLTNLHTLSIDYFEELLECGPRLVDALSALTTVRSLHVTSFGLRTYDVVNTIQSPLVHVHVDGDFPSWEISIGYASDSILCDPLDLLIRHQATLEKIFVAYFDITEANVQPGPSTGVFPRVSALALMHCRLRERAILVNAYPHLRELEITGQQRDHLARRHEDFEDDEDDELPEADINAMHDMNRHEIRSWPSLDYVYGDADMVYLLSLRCPVRRLDVVVKIEETHLAWMQTVIGDTLPARLVIRCGFPKPLRPNFNYSLEHGDIFGLLDPGPATDNITHFGLDLGLRSVFGEPIYYQRAIVKLLSQLKIWFFTFRVHATDTEYEGEHGPPKAEDLAILRKFGGKFLAFWAARIAEAVPTLEHLSFRIWDQDVHWRIARAANGAPQFTRLDPDEGRAFVQAEGMQWYWAAKHAPMVSEEEAVAVRRAMALDPEADDDPDLRWDHT